MIHDYDGPSPTDDDHVDVLGVLWILTTFLSDEDGQRIDENYHMACSLGEEDQIVKHLKLAKLHIAWMLAKVLTNGPKLFRLTPEMTEEVRRGLITDELGVLFSAKTSLTSRHHAASR